MQGTREKAVEQILDALSRNAVDEVAEQLHPDLVFDCPWHPALPEPLGRDGALGVFGIIGQKYRGFTLSLVDQYPLDDDRILAEFRSHAEVVATGEPYDNHYLTFFTFAADGRVVGWREFSNPLALPKPPAAG